MLAVGFHVTGGRVPAKAYPATTILEPDQNGIDYAKRSDLVLDRMYFKGAPDAAGVARMASRSQFENVVIGNEPNHPIEKFPGDAKAFAAYWTEIARAVPDKRVWFPSPSPGFSGWHEWIIDCREAVESSAGIAVHAYGSLEQIKDVVYWYSVEFPGVPLFLSEWNFGSGQTVDIDKWADATIVLLLEWLSMSIPVCIGATYFAWQWDQDTPEPSSTDAEHTRVVINIDKWVEANPYKKPPEAKPLEPTEQELRAFARAAAIAAGYPFPGLFERQITQESGWNPTIGSPAGALGIAQIVPKYHPDVDPLDPFASLDYAAKWMAALFREYGNITLPLVHYNGGAGAVAAWREGKPYAESCEYVDAIVGPATIAQFGGPLTGEFTLDQIKSACCPIALAGAAYLLGRDISAGSIREIAISRPDIWNENDGIVSYGKASELARLAGLQIDWFTAETSEVQDALNRGIPVIISTPAHYYLAQRRSRMKDDPELLVWNTGLARRDGKRWMSLDAIGTMDGGIYQVGALSLADRTIEATDPTPATEPPDAVTAALDQLWQSSEILNAMALENQRAIIELKRALGRE